MKVAVIFLVVLGLLAAVSAALLVSALTGSRSVAQPERKVEEVDVYVATRDLPAMSVVPADAVEAKKVAKAALPRDAVTSSAQLVGKVVTRNVAGGETFTKASFVAKQQGVYLAATLPRGKRAMSISLPDWSGMAGLLYPGCVVDLLVSLNRPGDREGETVSTTLLQGLQVLAIGSESVASEAKETTEFKDKQPGALSGERINLRMITLLVDTKQAEMLQLAVQNGNIALAMRNPLDAEREERRLTKTSELSSVTPAPTVTNRLADAAAAVLEQAAAERLAAPPAPTKPVAPKPVWETTIVRGGASERRQFPMKDATGPATATDDGPNVAATEATDDEQF